MYKLFVLTGALIFFSACDKEIARQTPPSIVELLTQKEWILTSYGYDDNKNGVIDPSEESARDCEKDNSYLFKPNGTGNVYDNALTCGNGITDHTFNWTFINNETGLDFVFGIANILTLNENDLVVYYEIGSGDVTKFIMRFRH